MISLSNIVSYPCLGKSITAILYLAKMSHYAINNRLSSRQKRSIRHVFYSESQRAEQLNAIESKRNGHHSRELLGNAGDI